LDGIANTKTKAVNRALMNKKSFTAEEAGRIINETSKPFLKKMDEARQKFVDEGKHTGEEAKAIVGVDEYRKKEIREARRHLQEALNKIQSDMNAAVRTLLDELVQDKAKFLTKLRLYQGLQQQITEVSKPFEERMDKCREFYEKNRPLTAEEVKAIIPTIGSTEEGGGRGENDKVAAPSRVVTDKGYPVTKLGWQKYVEIKKEVDKRDQDLHGIYIYNDFTGHGIKEVVENTASPFFLEAICFLE
jgi:hypothetical protein